MVAHAARGCLDVARLENRQEHASRFEISVFFPYLGGKGGEGVT